jgi:branched-chain amino acid transport system substrate-binding protein
MSKRGVSACGVLMAVGVMAVGVFVSGLMAQSAVAQDRVIKIGGFGAKSGVLRPFGDNSEAAMLAAAAIINRAGGVRLADGVKVKMVVEYRDDKCDPNQGVAILKSYADSDWLATIGTTCSSVLEPVFKSLQRRVEDSTDQGAKIPIFADVAMKTGLAQISEWSFRNIPDEVQMYDALWQWMKVTHPELKTVYGGVEENFVHSKQTWYNIIKERAKLAGYDVRGESKWLVDDVNFAAKVEEIKASDADIVVISAHPFTACGVLREMERTGVKPRAIVGLTSVTTPETLEKCGPQANGMIVPTSFAPINDKAIVAAEATAKLGGYADLHSMAAWENIFALKQVIESEDILAKPESVQQDREKIRGGLEKLTSMDGLLGVIGRIPNRESNKKFVLVEAKNGAWSVIENRQPGQ